MSLTFKLAPCSYEAAKFAVLNWHYSKKMPASIYRFGAWENGKFIGAVLFGTGANYNASKKFGIQGDEILELVRVALKNNHVTPTSAIVAAAIKELKKRNSKIQVLISYADTGQGHVGTIYQATNWIYTGYSSYQTTILIDGVKVHRRTLSSRFGSIAKKNLEKYKTKTVREPRKHTYYYFFNQKLKNKIVPLPYPKKTLQKKI